jgi:predicted Fe-Mo cluster-binding NifX family protein
LDGDHFATVLDFAGSVLIVTHVDGAEAGRKRVSLEGLLPSVKVARLVGEGVSVVVCGAVSSQLAMMLWHAGIELQAGVTGEVQSVIRGYSEGALMQARFQLPETFASEGCPWQRRRAQRRAKQGRARGKGTQ